MRHYLSNKKSNLRWKKKKFSLSISIKNDLNKKLKHLLNIRKFISPLHQKRKGENKINKVSDSF